MDHYEVRKYPGWHHHILRSMLAHFFLWHLKRRLGKKSACPHRVAAADAIGSRLTPADLYDCRGPGVDRVGAAAQAPGLSSAPQAAPRGRVAAEMGVFFTMKIIFVVKNRFHTPNFTFRGSITRATRSLSLTHCPGWSSHPLRRWGWRANDGRRAAEVSQDE